jgi:hypothetical protein
MRREGMRRFRVGIIFVCLLLLITEAQASIILRVLAVNPSKTEKQIAPIKVYLPKEIKPENIIDKEDLEIGYDSQQATYYLYGDYELEPGEVLEKEIELEDIWVIPEEEIETLRTEVEKTAKLLEKTDFKERFDFLKESIDRKLNRIIERQRVSAASPEKHISDYRENLKLLEEVKNDLVVARSFLAQAKKLPTIKIWRLFIAIIVFLGVLGLTFYFIWQRQVKTITVSGLEIGKEPKEEVDLKVKEVKEEEKKIKAEDIEKIIREEE